MTRHPRGGFGSFVGPLLLSGGLSGATACSAPHAGPGAPSIGADAGAEASLTCPMAAPSAQPAIQDCQLRADGSAPVIDDFESGTLFLPAAEGRQGKWYAFTDGTSGCISAEVATDEGSQALHVNTTAPFAWPVHVRSRAAHVRTTDQGLRRDHWSLLDVRASAARLGDGAAAHPLERKPR